MSQERSTRRRRADGEQSRRKILDATAEVAGERGYDGTSIAAVSAKCGLPASSIYWHFVDKDDLIAAVIQRSFGTWMEAVTLPDAATGPAAERVRSLVNGVTKALLESPDFLRLGLMLVLERRPTEPKARTVFLEVRALTAERIGAFFAELAPELDEAATRRLTTYAIAGADGLFVAHQIDGDGVDLIDLFELHARCLLDAVSHEITRSQASPEERS